jgi:hypothetical protein
MHSTAPSPIAYAALVLTDSAVDESQSSSAAFDTPAAAAPDPWWLGHALCGILAYCTVDQSQFTGTCDTTAAVGDIVAHDAVPQRERAIVADATSVVVGYRWFPVTNGHVGQHGLDIAGDREHTIGCSPRFLMSLHNGFSLAQAANGDIFAHYDASLSVHGISDLNDGTSKSPLVIDGRLYRDKVASVSTDRVGSRSNGW